ncbi:hypothetical protein NQ318_001984 [Aromia moschata]|uniref:Uncharacterized protein n=1 Tax=Aromia moschata TaxID=1265417 RepID=A0AAV8Z4C5_9CUCU|nr:hypothetical protein NQ318_001984 [Aromia moschata]
MFHMNLRHTFSLPRYFRSYQQIKGNFRIKNVVICTNTQLNRAFEPSLQAEIMGEDHLLYHDEAYKFYHTIKEISDDLRNGITRYDGERGEAPAEDEDIMDFLRRLQIVTRYPPSGKLDQAIETIVAGSGLCESLERREYASHINARMMEWYDDKRGRYLTESDAKGYLCEFRSSKLCENLRHLRISFKPDDLRTTLQILHIVPQNEQTLSLVKVYQCLESEESRALFFTTEDAVGLQQQMVEVFRLPKYRYLIVCLKTLEWNPEDMNCGITEALKTTSKKAKKVVFIGRREDQLVELVKRANSDSYVRMEENIKFTDFTDESQEKLLERVLLFFEATL